MTPMRKAKNAGYSLPQPSLQLEYEPRATVINLKSVLSDVNRQGQHQIHGGTMEIVVIALLSLGMLSRMRSW